MYNKKNITSLIILWVFITQIVFTNVFSLSVKASETVSESVYSSQTFVESSIIGDVNGDEQINSVDFALMRMVLLGTRSFPITNGEWASDTDGNRIFNSIDFAIMRKFLLGIITVFPVEAKEENPFSYAIFSGNTKKDLDLKGSDIEICGNIHSNSSLNISSYDAKINGKCSAVNKVKVEGTIAPNSKYQIKDGVGKIDMNDYSDYFKVASQENGTYFSTDIDPVTGKPYWAAALKDMNYGLFIRDEDFKKDSADYLSCQYQESENRWMINGETLVLHKERPLFFDGNVWICNTSIEGSGFIVSTGNVTLNTMKFDGDGKMADIGIYAIGEKGSDEDETGEFGNIIFAMGSTQFKGLLYAPKGMVKLETSGTEILGSVVAEEIIARNNGLSITHVSTEAHETIVIPHKD